MARAGSNTKVVYGSYSFDSQPTPFVTLEQSMINDFGGPSDGRWGRKDNITINGTLTGLAGGDHCGTLGPSGSGYGNLVDAQLKLLSGFGQDFQNLEIQEYDGNTFVGFYTGYNCVVRSVNFDEGRYVGLLNYTIQLDGYDKNNWNSISNALGIVNPVDSYDFSQSPEDEVVTINHTVSAEGYNQGGFNALENAITFVRGRTGYLFETNSSVFAGPQFIPTGGDVDPEGCFEPTLISQSESINRMQGIYSVTEVYEADPSGCSGIVLRYTTNLDSGIADDYVSASIDGEAKHSKTGSFTDLQDYVSGLNLYNLLTEEINYAGLNDIPINLSITENPSGKAISFEASYDDNTFITDSDNAYFDYSVALSTDEITKITTATINGIIKSRGNLQQRETSALNYLNTGVYPDNDPSLLSGMANTCYQNFLGSTYSLNGNPTSLSIASGARGGEITVSASFNDKDRASEDGMLKDSTYSYQVDTAVPVFKPKPAVNENGLYTIFDTNVKTREKVSVSAQLIGGHVNDNTNQSNAYSATIEGMANTLINTLRNNLGDGAELRLDGESISRDDVGGSIQCAYEYSQNKQPILLEDEYKIGQTIDE